MSAATSGLDFDILAGDSGAAETVDTQNTSAETAAIGEQITGKPPTGNAKRIVDGPRGDDEAPARDILGEIADILMPGEEQEETAPEAKTKEPVEEKQEEKITAAKPVLYDAKLLQLASLNDIGPDEAQMYPSARALLGEIRLRELERSKAATPTNGKSAQPPAQEPVDDLPAPKVTFDEDTDPVVRKAIEEVNAFAVKLKERADRQRAEDREEFQEIKTEHEQAAVRSTLATQAKIAQVFDETVASWGDEFKEKLGVPSEIWKLRDAPQRKEVERLRNFVLSRKLGTEQLDGHEIIGDDAVAMVKELLAEARHALWPEQAKQSARNEIAKGLAKQRGGVGLRPTRSSRETEAPAQGDAPAKAAIGDYFAGLGMDPWGRSK